MSIERDQSQLANIQMWVEDFEQVIQQGARSARIQWDIEGHTDPLTLYANRQGTFIVEPGSKPVPASEWLNVEATA